MFKPHGGSTSGFMAKIVIFWTHLKIKKNILVKSWPILFLNLCQKQKIHTFDPAGLRAIRRVMEVRVPQIADVAHYYFCVVCPSLALQAKRSSINPFFQQLPCIKNKIKTRLVVDRDKPRSL